MYPSENHSRGFLRDFEGDGGMIFRGSNIDEKRLNKGGDKQRTEGRAIMGMSPNNRKWEGG